MPVAKSRTKPASKRAAKKKSVKRTAGNYDVHPAVMMVQRWIADLPARTGRSLAQWTALIRKQKLKDEKAAREWLKREHGFGTNNASWLAQQAVGTKDAGISDADPKSYLKLAKKYVNAMYAGNKAHLRPLHDAIEKLGKSIAKDVKLCPCTTMVPMFRHHVIAQIKPTTQTRIDLGLALGPMMKDRKKFPARLIDTGGFARKDRITHRIPIASKDDIDADVRKWLETAYRLDD